MSDFFNGWPEDGEPVKETVMRDLNCGKWSEEMGYQDRVREEQTELTEKLVKLRQYIATEEFHTLKDHDKHLLMAQSMHMSDYSNILAQRISEFSDE